MIPSKLSPQILQIGHYGHMGTEKCLLKAKGCLFWPGISRDIKKMTSSCPTCMHFSTVEGTTAASQCTVPSFPWQKVAMDLLDYHGAQYPLVADYYNKYPILRKLNSTTSTAVINHRKSIFAEYGIPETLISDNRRQYSSQEFASFCDL